MSYPMTQLGGSAFNHHPSSSSTEAEYDRLRGLARQEAGKRSSCLAKSHQAYERGDGAAAHELSEEGKRHGALMDTYNRQAAEYIFRENNAVGRVDGDTVDLHGLFVEEAEAVLEERIRYARGAGQTGLHVIVGKGNHSPNHIQKIKPKVEQLCQELGLQYATEANAGRMFINLQGGPAVMPQHLTAQQGGGYQEGYGGVAGAGYGYGGGQHGQHGQHHGHQGYQHQQEGYHGQQGGYQQQGQQEGYQGGGNTYPQMSYQQGGGGGQYHGGGGGGGGGGGAGQQDPNAELEAQVKKYLPKVLRMCRKQCCTVM